jgi:hypothetical protein
MLPDWKAEIARVAYWKQMGAEHDSLRAFPWHAPRVAAAPERIEAAQQACGVGFSAQFQDFLRCADGWLAFYMLVDLFGTPDFTGGRSRNVLRRPELLELLSDCDLRAGDVVPIGASEFAQDVFIHVSPASRTLPGGVVWFLNEEVGRFETFGEFFGSMVNYNAMIAEKLSGKRP